MLPLVKKPVKLLGRLEGEPAIEFIIVRPETPLYLSVGFRAPRGVPSVRNTKIVQMPREVSAEFGAIVGPDALDRHWEALTNLVDEVDRRAHGVMIVNLQDAVAGRFVEGCELVKAPRTEGEMLHIHLDGMAWDEQLLPPAWPGAVPLERDSGHPVVP